MKFIGDLSKQDVSVLKRCAKGKKVLEFGCGGSTQIFSQIAGSVLSLETHKGWIKVTKEIIAELGGESYEIRFLNHVMDFKLTEKYDVIFVDGEWGKRLEFAIKAWPYLKEDGVMLFHDTRRDKDKNIVSKFFISKIKENLSLTFNYRNSNISVIKKGVERKVNENNYDLPYENWNEVEGKEKWMYNGMEERPTNWKELL